MIRFLAVDPPYPEFLQDRFFDAQDPLLNRDGQLEPYRLLRERLRALGIETRTPDRIPADALSNTAYISFGGCGPWWDRPNVRRPAYIYMEAPSSIPGDYARATRVCRTFENVLTFNRDVIYDHTRTCILDATLHEYAFPSLLAYNATDNPDISTRLRRICVIAANKSAKLRYRGPASLYEFRKELIGRLAQLGAVDVYGGNWQPAERGFWRNISPAAVRYRRSVRRAHRGRASAKLECMRQYAFALCIETHRMANFVTEKPIDSLRAGCIPIYFGAPNVADILPRDCFIDLRDFRSLPALVEHCLTMDPSDMQAMVEAGQSYLRSPAAHRFTPEHFVDTLLRLITSNPDPPAHG